MSSQKTMMSEIQTPLVGGLMFAAPFILMASHNF